MNDPATISPHLYVEKQYRQEFPRPLYTRFFSRRGHCPQPGTYTHMTWCSRYQNPRRGCTNFDGDGVLFGLPCGSANHSVPMNSPRANIWRTLRAVSPSPSQAPLASRIRGLLAVVPRGRQNSSRAQSRRQSQAPLCLRQQSRIDKKHECHTKPVWIHCGHLCHIFFRCEDEFVVDDI
jgi:hypothetical protein